MDSWISHMPRGMMLKSDGFASNISDPNGDYTLGQFCAEKGIAYHDKGIPVSLETFAGYGLAFRDRKVPELEDKNVVSVDPQADGFAVGPISSCGQASNIGRFRCCWHRTQHVSMCAEQRAGMH